MRVPTFARALLVAGSVVAITLVAPGERTEVALAAECTPRLGPSIPPPASVPSGIPGVHAYWYGQSGYPTLCPGQTSVATVAYYNSGTEGWQSGCCLTFPTYARISLGTSGPQPGQDQASILGGNGTRGTPQTGWNDFNRPAIQPASWIGPNQVAWFQFTVKAPQTPGTYRLYLRPLIESRAWLEDFGVYWQVTVIATSTTPERVTVDTVDTGADVFIAGGKTYLYDRNDGFEYGAATVTLDDFERALSTGDVIEVRYEPSAAERSSFNIVDDPPYGVPQVSAQVGNFDRGSTNNDVRITLTLRGSPAPAENVQRATVPAGTAVCSATSGSYAHFSDFPNTPDLDRNVQSGTYCYRAHTGMFGYSAPVTIANPPTAAPVSPPISVDARAIPSAGGATDTFDFLDKLKIAFDAPMAVCGDDTVLRLRDADGTVAELSIPTHNIGCAINTDYENVGGRVYPSFTVITLTISAPPTIITPGSIPGLQVPATAVSATGIHDDSGRAWDLAGSTDIVFGDPD